MYDIALFCNIVAIWNLMIGDEEPYSNAGIIFYLKNK